MNRGIKVFPIDHSPGFLLHRLDTQMAAALHRAFLAAGYEITPEQWGVLSRLWEEEGVHQSRLAERVGKDRHNVTRILRLLERGGWIEKRADDSDGRRFNVFLTPGGRDLRGRLTPVVLGVLDTATGGLSAAELAELRRLQLHILSNLEAAAPATRGPEE